MAYTLVMSYPAQDREAQQSLASVRTPKYPVRQGTTDLSCTIPSACRPLCQAGAF